MDASQRDNSITMDDRATRHHAETGDESAPAQRGGTTAHRDGWTRDGFHPAPEALAGWLAA